MNIKEEFARHFNNLNKKISVLILKIFTPILIVFILFAFLTGSNLGKARYLIRVTVPATNLYIQLERNVMLMQKWLTYVAATRNEKGYDGGFAEAEKYLKLSQDDFARLRKLLEEEPDRLKKIDELHEKMVTYYDMGREVAKAYIEDGTASGNDMLNVFSDVEKKLNFQLHEDVTYFREKADEVNQSLSVMLVGSLVLFILMGITGAILGAITYLFLVKREELHESNKKLRDAMDALWGEMELAKKIQTVLLPRRPEISGLEISAQMIPADEIGGDYYDILNVAGRDWIVIGDVSGHGVPAGLVMMMVQTAIHVTLSKDPNLPPSELLEHINKTIHYNIKQLGEDKYMTITVLAAHKDGSFNFSGLHQDIMIYRHKTDTVELTETNGIWIGLYDDIKGMLENEVMSMEKNDVVLLYTDGITEAVDSEGAMFSSERLAEIFKECAKEKPEVIKNSIIRSLKDFKCNDDVTLVVLKRIVD